MNKNKKLGFTLAEVLIVIGIIGVVAALTLPNLNHATGDKEKVTKVKKIYSALTEAVDRAQVIYGPFDTWFQDNFTSVQKNERFAKRVIEFLKVSKDCGFDEGCFSTAPLLTSDGTIFIENYSESMSSNEIYTVTLSDNTSLGFSIPFTSLSKIVVDIDGSNKGKNQQGSDIFSFSIFYDTNAAINIGVSPNQIIPSTRNYPISFSNGSLTEYGYTAWVIENGNLDYLKCPDELNWETKTSCE